MPKIDNATAFELRPNKITERGNAATASNSYSKTRPVRLEFESLVSNPSRLDEKI